MKFMKIKLIAISALIMVLIGCATISFNPVAANIESFIIPEIGTENTVYIGDPLIREGRTAAQDAINLKIEIGTAGLTAFHPSGYYILKGVTNDGFLVYQYPEKYNNGWGWLYAQIVEDQNGVIYLQTNSGKTQLEGSKFVKKKYTVDASDEYKQSLIYTGRENDIIKFTYREFMSDMARPAFTIDATYDMKEGNNIIRFKGASLEVIEADNQSISYKLLSGFKAFE